MVPIGAMLAATTAARIRTASSPNNFRPLLGFSDLNLTTNNLYSNYNSLQVTWARTGPLHGQSELHVRQGAWASSGPFDQFNIANNYGVLAANRTHIFNAAYSFELGNFTTNKIAGGFINGWQISGITQFQSGANLSGSYSNQNFNMNLNSYKVPGTDFNVSNVSILGTPNIQLNPILTCDPASEPRRSISTSTRVASRSPRRRREWPDCDTRRSTDRPSSTRTWGCSRTSRSASKKSCNSASLATIS